MARPLTVLVIAAALSASAAACGGGSTAGTNPASSNAGTGPAGPASSGFAGAALPAGIAAPGFTLTDQNGRSVSLADYRGRVVILAFVYARCGASCVLVAQQVRGALDQLPEPPAAVLLSADPGRDDAASVAAFLRAVSLTGRAAYLSGPPARLRAALAAYHVKPPGRGANFEPPASVVLIDPAGHERVLYGLEQLTPEALAHDVGRLRAGAQ
jgi:protein SCO1/2